MILYRKALPLRNWHPTAEVPDVREWLRGKHFQHKLDLWGKTNLYHQRDFILPSPYHKSIQRDVQNNR